MADYGWSQADTLSAQANQGGFNHGRIAKPLRGGGGGGGQPVQQQSAAQIPMYQTIAAGSPLARVQADESASGKRREWRDDDRGAVESGSRHNATPYTRPLSVCKSWIVLMLQNRGSSPIRLDERTPG
jgi:hypothetical protein